jgi:D-alanine-D-alanine ligase
VKRTNSSEVVVNRKLKVAILYDAIEDDERAKAQARGEPISRLVYEEIGAILSAAGHTVHNMAARSATDLATQLARDDSDLIFNVCESLGGVPHYEQNVAAVLELFGKRFTGTGSVGLAIAGDKALAKKLLSFHGINTPRFAVMESGQLDVADDLTFPMFVKPANADASIGIDHRSIVRSVKELMERISYIETEFAAPALIEEFIEGREIYASVLGGAKPEPLPLVEWDFSRVPAGTPKIASAEAKWDTGSTRYKDAPEVIVKDLPDTVVQALQQAAIEAFRSLKLRDYGRVDMRVRKRPAGAPTQQPSASPRAPADLSARDRAALEGWEFYLIEVNPNPHLATDSELPLAAKEHGLAYPQLIEVLVQNAMARDLR